VGCALRCSTLFCRPSFWSRICDFITDESFSVRFRLRLDLPIFVLALILCFSFRTSKDRRNLWMFWSNGICSLLKIISQNRSCPTLLITAATVTRVCRDSVLLKVRYFGASEGTLRLRASFDCVLQGWCSILNLSSVMNF
jgi:hypothetical protein